ncbi:MAG: hypothetical protein A2087_00060 [Spirochaetes bacterium GWD1_61_31]|nr:MAG: hypothetical protein A2Y37_06735 [Spirochaetes bacterium GWB1_60_80]OHD30771.1 MAG: hypothetical protein A2004_04260 [Spirochaetes bacterium GWC1_61_12]OHD42940.1 MAG: hypothetical protein A2087_00060 [Spirochaetes bacterium GWD1_61_31]OHD46270.1 MAG: hypothetical protein A2Y35_07010 [Spirochaetes bacterium GWE1_60_18]OHD60877.1 MAG: hypothetical protein A2Y32_11755 [Spirochaetes bacterium GWF1_60_12]HAP42865.1 restriction endonuclease subunit S [Spirochaetaceae bacterium]
MSVPKLRFPEFRDAGEWEESTVGDKSIKVGSGVTPNGGDKNYRVEGRPFVRSQNVGWGILLLEDIAYIDEETHSTFSGTEIMKNDVLLNITGASIGRSAIANHAIEGGNVNQHVCIIRTRDSELDPKFLNQYLLSEYGQKQIDSFQAGGNRQGLNFTQIRSFRFWLPSLPEQQKIADCLSSLDELIAAHKQKLTALGLHKKGLMQQLFPAEGETVPCLRFPEFRDAGEWEEKRFGDICKFVRGPFGGALTKNIFVKNGYAVYEQSHAIYADFSSFRYFITAEKFKELRRFSVEQNDIIMSCSGTMGRFAVIPEKCKEGLINQALLKLTVKSNVIVSFVKYILELPLNQEKLLSQSAGGAIKNVVGVDIMKEIPFQIPSLPEQQKIADCLSSLDELIAAQVQKIETLKMHKKGLMQQLFPAATEGGK